MSSREEEAPERRQFTCLESWQLLDALPLDGRAPKVGPQALILFHVLQTYARPGRACRASNAALIERLEWGERKLRREMVNLVRSRWVFRSSDPDTGTRLLYCNRHQASTTLESMLSRIPETGPGSESRNTRNGTGVREQEYPNTRIPEHVVGGSRSGHRHHKVEVEYVQEKTKTDVTKPSLCDTSMPQGDNGQRHPGRSLSYPETREFTCSSVGCREVVPCPKHDCPRCRHVNLEHPAEPCRSCDGGAFVPSADEVARETFAPDSPASSVTDGRGEDPPRPRPPNGHDNDGAHSDRPEPETSIPCGCGVLVPVPDSLPRHKTLTVMCESCSAAGQQHPGDAQEERKASSSADSSLLADPAPKKPGRKKRRSFNPEAGPLESLTEWLWDGYPHAVNRQGEIVRGCSKFMILDKLQACAKGYEDVQELVEEIQAGANDLALAHQADEDREFHKRIITWLNPKNVLWNERVEHKTKAVKRPPPNVQRPDDPPPDRQQMKRDKWDDLDRLIEIEMTKPHPATKEVLAWIKEQRHVGRSLGAPERHEELFASLGGVWEKTPPRASKRPSGRIAKLAQGMEVNDG